MDLHRLQTPCFVVDKPALAANFEGFHRALAAHWGAHVLGYSVKTNPLPWVLAFAKEQGCFAEVVSDTEYLWARKIGFPVSRIIFNGPVKGKECFFEALAGGAVVNLDSQRELAWLEEYAAAGGKAKVGLRVNLNLELLCPGETLTGKSGGRFGYSYETGALGEAVKRVRALEGITLAGLHMHTNSQSRSVNVFRSLAGYAVKIARDYALELEYLDIGGGFYGGGKNISAYDDYARAIAEVLRPCFDPEKTCLMAEPGGAVICTPVDYFARVVDVKETYADCFAVTEASRLHIDHELKKTSYLHRVHPAGEGEDRPTLPRQVVCGYTCMENDRLFVLEDQPRLQEGDLLQFYNAGAYSIAFCPQMFIDYSPAVYVKDGEELTLVRRKQTVEDAIRADSYTL
ncbi:MAG: hypothetical protein IIV90_03510 [Oscillospiraceae bacterium]|nr:hypothetical protein [Oscillospiraceae bacterium]